MRGRRWVAVTPLLVAGGFAPCNEVHVVPLSGAAPQCSPRRTELAGSEFRRRLCARRGDRTPVRIRERQPTRNIGVPRDTQLASVVQSVVMRAQSDQVPRLGDPTVGPVDDVVDLQPTVLTAPRYPTTSAVTQAHQSAGSFGYDTVVAADADRDRVVREHRIPHPVAGEVLGDRLGNRHVRRIDHRTVEVEMEVQLETISSR